MSTLDTKLEQHRDTGGKPRRTYASLKSAAGYRIEFSGSMHPRVSIQPMDRRTYWRHVGPGKWNAADALYELEEEQ